MLTTKYTDHLFFPHSRGAECNDMETCIKRMTSDGDDATISAPAYIKYLANEVGYQSALKFPCALDGNIIHGSFVTLFTKGNPLVN
jgi:hypothetical protein